MRSFVLILICAFTFFSCRKERLDDEKELLVGQWKLEYAIRVNRSVNPSASYCRMDTITFSGNDIPIVTFLKKGKIILDINDKKKRFSINFKDKPGRYMGYYENGTDSLEICSSVSKNIVNLDYFFGAVQSSLQLTSYIRLFGRVNENWLVLISSPKIIDDSSDDYDEDYYNIFRRVN